MTGGSGSGSWVSTGLSRAASASTDAFLIPSGWQPGEGKVGVIYLHGATNDAYQSIRSTYPTLRDMCRAIAANRPLVAITTGDTWGNATAMTKITNACAYLWATLGAVDQKVILVGGSMGGGQALTWAGNNIAKTVGVVGVTPVSDLNDFVVNNRGGLAASVNAAYGGAYNNATDGPVRNPVLLAAAGAYGSTPVGLWYGDTDVIVVPSTVTTLAASIGASATLVPMVGGHNTSLDVLPVTDIAAYVEACAAAA